MAFSVNTNAGAFIALQNLNKTSAALSKTQNAINTGLKISSAKDNAAVFAIAQNLRSDVGGLNAVKQSLDRALGAADGCHQRYRYNEYYDHGSGSKPDRDQRHADDDGLH